MKKKEATKSYTQPPQVKPSTQTREYQPTRHAHPEVRDEIHLDQRQKYKVDYIKRTLDEKIDELVQNLRAKQKENTEIEDDVILRLNSLKGLNAQIESIYKSSTSDAAQLQVVLKEAREHHEENINRDEEKQALERQLKEMEKVLNQLRGEAEQQAATHEKLRVEKEDRLRMDLRVKVDKSGNNELREQLKERGEKKQNIVDQERDFNRDIF